MTDFYVTLQRINTRRLINPVETRTLSDSELLRQLCNVDEDQALYDEFVRRFYKEIKAECVSRCRSRKLDVQLGVQIAHETFEKVRKHKTYREEAMKVTDPHKGILIYLIRIAVNLFNDHHRHRKKEQQVVPHPRYFQSLAEVLAVSSSPSDLRQIKEATLHIFKQLNAKEQKVVLADLEHKKHQKYLPDDITESLAVELGVKKDTVRKIRERAILKIKNAINEYNKA